MTTSTLWNFAIALEQDWYVRDEIEITSIDPCPNSLHHSLDYRLMVCGSALNGIVAGVTAANPPLISVIWFPLRERTTATAIAAGSGNVGAAIAFITG